MKTTAANAITRAVEATDSVFYFREIGDGIGTPLIVLNHPTSGFEDWDPAFVGVLAARHRIIIFDNPASNIPDMALGAIKFIGALGLNLVDLVGFSMGAFVAQRIVRDRPDLVRRVILAGAIPAGGAGIIERPG
jgi:pimeloyl-ACP methyl ester carboxylesterase